MICPNCGGEATGAVCPYCGSKLADEARPKRRSHNRSIDEGDFAPAPWNDPELLRQDKRQAAASVARNETPLVEFLRELASSSLILVSAILMSVYSCFVCYTCGARGIKQLDVLSNAYGFDSAVSLAKLNYVAVLLPCVARIVLSVWLTVSLWSLYSAGVAGKRKGLSYHAANSLRGYARAGMKIFKLLTVTSLITLLYAAFLKLSDADLLPDSIRQLFDAVMRFTDESATQAERDGIAGVISQEAIVRAALFVPFFILETVRFSMLHKLLVTAANMIHYGETTYYRFPALAPLTLLSGLLSVVNATVWLLILTKHTSNDFILLYAPAYAHGFVTALGAVMLHRFHVGLKRV